MSLNLDIEEFLNGEERYLTSLFPSQMVGVIKLPTGKEIGT